MKDVYRKWLEIDKSALRNNINYIKSKLKSNTKIMAVVKADSYGCGSVECSKLFLEQGAEFLAVSSLGEAIVLREHKINAPILILGYVNTENIKEAIENDLILTVYDIEICKEINKIAESINKKVKVHINLNTGMNRLGFYYGKDDNKNKDTIKEIVKLSELSNIKIEGIYSHFACEEKDECKKQFDYFIKAINILESKNILLGLKHICNSYAAINYPEFQLDMIRPGLSLYGYGDEDLKPAMSFKTIVINVFENDIGDGISYNKTYISKEKEKIAVLPIGYADGLSRILSNNISFTINNKEYKQVGNICMDLCMVKVDNSIKLGDIVNIFGKDSNNTVLDLSNKIGTIPYEIICRMGKRLPRIYIK
ncbi:MAG TPA: alanine racemase [Bacilli bacterium]|nr:alanine racemase [Bacilli bacterium]